MWTLSKRHLEIEQAAHRGTGGTTAENRRLRFAPALLDSAMGTVYLRTFADGRPFPFRVLEGSPLLSEPCELAV